MAKKLIEQWSVKLAPGQKSPPSGAVLIGAPDDRGVFNVGGRVGAATGPQAVRSALGKLQLGPSGELERFRIHYGEDIAVSEALKQTHHRVRSAVSGALTNGRIPIVIGGGHDYGHPHIGGVADFYGGGAKVGLINIDAHLDVREVENGIITSGSPYFMALEEGCLRGPNFVELGIQPHCNHKDRFKYLNNVKAQILMLDDARNSTGAIPGAFSRALKKLTAKKLKIAVSVDLDAVASAFAPGVSAPQSDGLTPSDLFEIMSICASNSSVISLGFFEISPPMDRDSMTARLCATAIHRFCVARANTPKISRPSSKRR